jgi:L-fucose isomerase-like protein
MSQQSNLISYFVGSFFLKILKGMIKMALKIGFIPTHRTGLDINWAKDMKNRSIAQIKSMKGMELIYPDDALIDDGIVTTYEDSLKVIRFFKTNEIDGIILGAMSFGEEVPVLNICEKFSELPILVYGTKEGTLQPDGQFQSYSMCGTLSITSGLYKRGIKFKFIDLCFPEEDLFLKDVSNFIKASNTYKSFIGARIGAIGTRPSNFETVAVNEIVMLQNYNQKIIPMSLLELYKQLNEFDNKLLKEALLKDIQDNYNCGFVTEDALDRIVRLEAVLKNFIESQDLSCLAIQCWSAIQEVIKISPCLTMGRLTGLGVPSACEVDIFGALTMLVQYANSLNSSTPHIMDIVTNSNSMENVFLTYHCGNASRDLAKPGTDVVIKEHGIFGGLWGRENCMGTGEFQLKPGKIMINRLVEDNGIYKMLITEGEVIDSPDNLRGSWGWVKVRDLNRLYRTLAEEGFIHHYCMTYDNAIDSMIDFCDFAGIEKIIV